MCSSDLSLATLGCDGATADGTDCDDADAAISPGAAEVCDGVDQDCDGAVDDDATDAGTWYTDADGDGWGDNATAVLACTDDALVSAGGDCDDADDATHPDAAEDCGAGLDTNCDGFTGTDDADGDGAVACEDCDDGDPTRSPTVDETCDGRDQDCDGRIDEEPVDGATWYTEIGRAHV